MAADTVTETTTTKAEVKQFTLDEISKHQSHDDCWLIIGNESNGMYEYICIYVCQKKRTSMFDVWSNARLFHVVLNRSIRFHSFINLSRGTKGL